MLPVTCLWSFVAVLVLIKASDQYVVALVKLNNNFCQKTSIDENSARDFAKMVRIKKANFVYIHLNFSDNITLKSTPDIFIPTLWTWTFKTHAGAYAYLHFPFDFQKLSLGILGTYTVHSYYIPIKVWPPFCQLYLGKKSVMKMLADAMGNMVNSALVTKETEYYENSVFCYPRSVDLSDFSRIVYYMSVYFALQKDYIGHQCCKMTKNKSSVSCDVGIVKETDWIVSTYVIGIVLYLFLPFILLQLAISFSFTETDEIIDSQSVEGYEYLNGHPSEQQQKWLYFGKHKPVTVLKLFSQVMTPLIKRFPVAISRLERIMVLILSPIAIYFQLYIYQKDLAIKLRINHHLPVGFLALPFGYEMSRDNWQGFLGGPYIIYGVYFVCSLVLVCIPRRLSKLFEDVFHEDCKTSNITYLILDIKFIERLGSTKFIKLKGPEFFYGVCRANLCMILNTEFYFWVKCFIVKRFKVVQAGIYYTNDYSSNQNNVRPFRFLVMFIFTLIYILLCIIEALVFLLYYGFPTVFLFVTGVRGYLSYRHRVCNSCQTSRLIKFLQYSILCIIFTGLLLHMSYAFSTIFIASITFITEIFVFTYIGLIVYPNIAFGYFIAVSTIGYYFWAKLRNITENYLSLLFYTIKSSEDLENNMNYGLVKVSNDTLQVYLRDDIEITHIAIANVFHFELTSEQSSILQSSSGEQHQMVQYDANLPGIPKDLFDYVVEKHSPVRAFVFKTLIKITITCVFVISAISLILVFERNNEINFIMQLATGVIINIILRMAQFFRSNVDEDIEKQVLQSNLNITVEKYWKNKIVVSEMKTLQLVNPIESELL